MRRRRRGSSHGELFCRLLLSLLCLLPPMLTLARASGYPSIPATVAAADTVAAGATADRAAATAAVAPAAAGASGSYLPVSTYSLHRRTFHHSHTASAQATAGKVPPSHVRLSSSVSRPTHSSFSSTTRVRPSSRLPSLAPLPAMLPSHIGPEAGARAGAGVIGGVAAAEAVARTPGSTTGGQGQMTGGEIEGAGSRLPVQGRDERGEGAVVVAASSRIGGMEDGQQSLSARSASYNTALMPSIGISSGSLQRQQQLLKQQRWRQWQHQMQRQQQQQQLTQVQQQQQQQVQQVQPRNFLMPSISAFQPHLLQTPEPSGTSSSPTQGGAQGALVLPLLPHTNLSGSLQRGNQMQPPEGFSQWQGPTVVHPVQQQPPTQPQEGQQPMQAEAGKQPMQARLPMDQPAVVNYPQVPESTSHQMKPRDQPLAVMQKKQRMRDREVDCPYRPEGQGHNLHQCAMGYARWGGVTGGKGKVVYWVTSSMDHPTSPLPGSLRWALNKHRSGAIIRFSRSMAINLTDRLFVRSDTTIDGRGATVKINGPMAVYRSRNVIIHNVAIGNAKGNTDALHIRNSSRVWVDHCKVTNAYRGTIDVVKGSTNVTISNCFIRNFGFTMLLGAADNDTFDQQMRVTVYRNWFAGSGQRQPHGRWGKIHVANNLYTNWTYYCLGGRVHANIRSDRNIFIAGKGRKEVTPWFGPQSPSIPGFDNTPTIRSFNDSLRNGATFHVFLGTPPKPTFVPPYKLPLHTADDALRAFVTKNAGPRVGSAPLLPCTSTTCWSCC
ncbi:hypothetical protein CLOM_g22948 [Closterium sp. NIES-68]|nr:hypothetical protein CLOM_g22948 [Closterium sp. NIES-68]GJP57509.1 hypothetical protein CLOP_g12219 [Closterium sp. NIES-67]